MIDAVLGEAGGKRFAVAGSGRGPEAGNKGGEIGKLSQKAAATVGAPDARFLLQGRNEHTGILVPDERSLKYGKTERKLLA